MPKPLPKPFILLNIHKTGTRYISEFVRHADLLSIARKFGMDGVLLRHPGLHRTTLKWWWRLHRRGVRLTAGRMHSREHHIFHFQLPAPLRQLPAIACLREPLSWCASQYAYMARKEFALLMADTLQRMLQDANTLTPPRKNALLSFMKKYLGNQNSVDGWSNISLEGYWHFQRNFRRYWMIHKELGVRTPDDPPLGVLACRALMFVHRDPRRLFAMSPQEMEAYFTDKHWRRDLCPGWFLRFEQLQEDLRCVMLEHLGYNRETLDAVEQLMPARVHKSSWKKKESAQKELEQNPRLCEEILRSERIYVEHILPLAGNFRND